MPLPVEKGLYRRNRAVWCLPCSLCGAESEVKLPEERPPQQAIGGFSTGSPLMGTRNHENRLVQDTSGQLRLCRWCWPGRRVVFIPFSARTYIHCCNALF